MRIFIVLREFYSPSKPIGGAERQALKLANCLTDKGATVKIVTGQWDWGQPSQDRIGKIPVDRHFTAWGIFNIKGLRRLSLYIYLITLFIYLFSQRKKYDIIHCHSALFGAFVVALAGRWFRKKTVVRSMASGVWGDVQRMQNERTIWGAKWMLSQVVYADCIVALNKQVADELVGIGVSPQKIVHIPNGVEITAENPKNRYGIMDKVVVLFVGRLHPQKGVDILLQAFKRAQESKPEIKWCLKLVGNGYLLDYLQKMSLDLSINQSVEFLGEVNNPESLYVSSDLFTLPSRSEGISNSLLEAMVHGLPCIVTDIPGNNDLIKDGENGFLTASDDFENMANAITELAGDYNLRRKIGEAAYRSVVENFSLDKITEQYLNLYRYLLSSKKHT